MRCCKLAGIYQHDIFLNLASHHSLANLTLFKRQFTITHVEQQLLSYDFNLNNDLQGITFD
ncbi:hypothetical protein TUM4438_17730 [Shewanella sairae]|uniref:Uncharacterized protein n=1 Tax=Shewanella sairae TaxID=190310 RepID=A0ABQ4PC03_9GAMM|nr:hypothetical protein TUM4438_17730 [Shewanella sairae]